MADKALLCLPNYHENDRKDVLRVFKYKAILLTRRGKDKWPSADQTFEEILQMGLEGEEEAKKQRSKGGRSTAAEGRAVFQST